MRKLVTIQRVQEVSPIANADRIEVVRILGWNVVVQKGLGYSVGDKVAFFEIDSFLPETDERFESFQSRGVKSFTHNGELVSGHVVTTAKLRGVISQGVVMPLSELGYTAGHIDALEVGSDITEAIGVLKWEEPIPTGGNIIGRFDSRFAPKTDAIRAQSLAAHWDEIVAMDWEPTLKVDGTSQTLLNDDGNIRIFGRNWELNNTSKGFQTASQFGLVDVVSENPRMAIQFELVGPGVLPRNTLKLDKLRPIVFDVWQDGMKVSRDQWDQRILALATPLLGDEWKPHGTLEEMIQKVDGLRGNFTKDVLDEGIVFHATSKDIPLYMDRNANFKIINNKFLLKHGI